MKKLFNQEYLEMLINSENFEQSQNKLERVILSMDIFGENFREDIAFIFNKINKNLIEPILRSISHNIKNIEFVRLLHSTREEWKRSRRDFPIYNTPLYESILDEYFPMLKQKIMSMPKFEYKFNAIQNASFQANIRSSTEKFKQFCRETELIQIASGEHSCYWMLENLIPNDDLYNDVIMEINNNYPVIGSELGFGYKSLTKQSQLNHIKTIGSAKFIEIINCPKLGKKYSHQCFNDSWGLAYFLNDENFLKAHDIQKIFEIVNNLNKETITPATVSFCSALMLSHCSVNALNRPSNYRINKGLDILHLPKYLLQDIQFLKTQKNHMLLDICLSIFKFCEIDSGINDDRNEYAHYDVRMELVGDLFDDDYYLTFVNKFWDLSNIKVKQQVTENTIINIFNETLNQNKNIYNLALIRFKNIINQEIVEPENFVKNLYSCFELNNQFEFLKRCLNDPDVSISQLLLKFNNSLNEENSDSTIKNIELFYRDLENMKMLSITEQKSVTQFKKMLCLIIEKNKLAQHLTTIV